MTFRKRMEMYGLTRWKAYVNSLISLIAPAASSTTTVGTFTITTGNSAADKSDMKSVVMAHLASLRTEIISASAAIADPMSKYHLQDVAKRIDKALNPKD